MTPAEDERFLPLPVKCVSDLIAAAQRHLERFGDTRVLAIIETSDPHVFCEVETVTSAYYDRFEEDGEHVFTVEAMVTIPARSEVAGD